MNNNVFLATLLSVAILFGYQYLWVKPHQQAVHNQAIVRQAEQIRANAPDDAVAARDRASVIADNPRIRIETPQLAGSLDLKGARFDDLELTAYHETVDPASPAITLLSPSGSQSPHLAFYAEFNWLAGATAPVAVPTGETVWQTSDTVLTPGHAATLTWDNGQGLVFMRQVAVDDQAMFTVTDSVANKGGGDVTLYPFGIVARHGVPPVIGRSAVFEGPLAVADGTLQEFKYKKLTDDGKDVASSRGGWLGITDKYWLVAMIPPQDQKLTDEFTYHADAGGNPALGYFQSDYRGPAMTVPAGGAVQQVTHLFAGAKRIELLDAYARQYDVPHFDKAIDFGWFYFLTRPFLQLLALLAKLVGSVGLAILLFTVILKLVTLPLSLKSYHSMAKMKALQPELKRLQERYADDKVKQSQEMMELYKREKVNPMAGCLPTVIQIPIFFALYKVLYISIEMRHAPFYGWITDMSAPDPTSVFTAFGHIPVDLPPALQIGVWPILMGISMFMQQRLSPQPPDKSQAKLFMAMPIIFTFMLARMPAGLVIYWTWSNLLGIAQQWFIMSRDAERMGKKA